MWPSKTSARACNSRARGDTAVTSPVCALSRIDAAARKTNPQAAAIQLGLFGTLIMSDNAPPKLAAVVTTYFKYSHAQQIVDRLLDGYGWNGTYHHPDRKSTRLNSSHLGISYAVFCLKK